MKAATKGGIAGDMSVRARTRWIADNSGCFCRARLASIRARKASAGIATSRMRISAIAGSRGDAVPMRRRLVVVRRQPGLLLELTRDAARDIDAVAGDVVGIGRTGRKIDAPRRRGVGSHLAHDKGAVGTAQRAHAKTVEHGGIDKAPVAPGEEAREIGREIAGAEAVADTGRTAGEQHLPVPDVRLLALLQREMRVDVGAPHARERPVPGLVFQVKRRDAMYDRLSHHWCPDSEVR